MTSHPTTRERILVLIAAALIGAPLSILQPRPALADAAGTALQFDGTNDYVTFGPAPALGVTTMTLEAWVKRASGGATMSTGSLGRDGAGGRPLAYPVVFLLLAVRAFSRRDL